MYSFFLEEWKSFSWYFFCYFVMLMILFIMKSNTKEIQLTDYDFYPEAYSRRIRSWMSPHLDWPQVTPMKAAVSRCDVWPPIDRRGEQGLPALLHAGLCWALLPTSFNHRADLADTPPLYTNLLFSSTLSPAQHSVKWSDFISWLSSNKEPDGTLRDISWYSLQLRSLARSA